MEENKKNYGETLVTINSPEFIDRLSEIKGSEPGITWIDLSKRVNDEFDLNLTPTRLSDIYRKEITREVTVNRYATKRLDVYMDTIAKRFGGIAKTTEKYHNIVKRTMSMLGECDDADLLEMIPKVLMAGKQVETVNRMGMSQIALIREEQDKLTLTQKTGMFTDEQVKSHMFKLLPKILTMLEVQGKIKILDNEIVK